MSSAAVSLYRQCIRTVPAYMADEAARSFFKLALLKEMTVKKQVTATKANNDGSSKFVLFFLKKKKEFTPVLPVPTVMLTGMRCIIADIYRVMMKAAMVVKAVVWRWHHT